MSALSQIVCVLVALIVAGCSQFQANPYASFSVGTIDEEGSETPAVVLIGDPQVSSRESLINDRIREVEHLETMIDKSKKVSFEPQLKRDLRVIRALSAQLGISFNPASGAAFERQEELDRLRTDVEMAKLRNELERLKNLSQPASDNGSSEQEPTETDPPSEPGDGDPSVEEIKTQLNKAVTSAENLVAELQKTAAEGRAADAAIKVSPEDHFEDLNAYRARLRQRQNEVRLDDVHDQYGHALYRLQFTAAVLPGEIKNKFAVLDMEVLPVTANDDRIRVLYEQWLAELSANDLRVVLSETTGFSRSHSQWERAKAEIESEDLAGRVAIRVPMSGRQTESTPILLRLFTYPDDLETIANMLLHDFQDLHSEYENFHDAEDPMVTVIQDHSGPSCTVSANYDGKKNTSIYQNAKAVLDSHASLSAITFFLSTLKATGGSGVDLETLESMLNRFLDLYTTADKVLKKMKDLSQVEDRRCFEPRTTMVPSAFKDRVSQTTIDNTKYWRGEARTFQVQPTERVQRISSVASAVNSMQLAFSLVASGPTKGIGLNAGAAAAKTAIGMVEAIERTPVVIGYTDRQCVSECQSANGMPVPSVRFGYIFGPKAVLNTEKNQLEYRHEPKNYPVFVDITVPSWWPAIYLKVRSAWAKNWHSGTQVLESVESRLIKVPLRPRHADAGRLTEFVVKSQSGSDIDAPLITSIYPAQVSACTREVVFIIAGDNLWRAPVAYLRGQRHKTIRVLPDMKGLEVTFDVNNLPVWPHVGTAQDKIIVWTSLGHHSRKVEVINTRNGKPCPGTSKTDAVASSLKPASSHFIGGKTGTIRINLAAPLPTATRNVKVIHQLLTTEGVAFPFQEADKTAIFPGRYVEGSAKVSPPTDRHEAAINGMLLRVGLSYQTIDGGERHPFWAGRTLVYYVNDKASRFKVDTDKINSLSETVTLTPPVKLNEGYPKFMPRPDNFTAIIKDHEKAKLSATADWNALSGKVVVSVRSESDAARKEFLTAACKGETQLVISASDPSGQSPLVESKTVKIKKHTAEEDCNSNG